MRSVLALVLVAACTPSAYAPPARLISLDSPTAPAARGTDVQGEIGRIGQMFGPDVAAGNFRARHGLTDNLVVEGEGGMARVENEGTLIVNQPIARSTTGGTQVTQASDSRNAYTARGGLILQGTDGAVRGALTLGAGGGYSPVAGGWTSIDAGGSVGGTGRWIRPWFATDLGFNQPVGAHPFTVQYDDTDQTDTTTLQMTQNLMVRGTLGLELGPVTRAVVLGLSVTRLYADTNGQLGTTSQSDSDGAFVAVAAGFRALL
jgi:hypothetical protein